jgi:hypothetical protein
VEYAFSIPSAVSNIVDGAPLGKVDTKVLKEFKSAIAGGYDAAAVERVFKAAERSARIFVQVSKGEQGLLVKSRVADAYHFTLQ